MDELQRLFRALGTDDDEFRLLTLPVELRDDGDAGPVLEGYGAVFNQDAQIGGNEWGWMERIAPGAFAQSLGEDDIRSFFNHNPDVVLGRNTIKTLTLEEDATGLRVSIRPPDTAHARDVITLIKRGDVNGMSFMFRTRKEEWAEATQKGELPRRTLLDVKLFEVGPVTFPAYAQTSISARNSAQAWRESQRSAVLAAAADSDRVRRLRLAEAQR